MGFVTFNSRQCAEEAKQDIQVLRAFAFAPDPRSCFRAARRTVSRQSAPTLNVTLASGCGSQGIRFDPELPTTLRLEFAKSNTKVTKPKAAPGAPPHLPAGAHAGPGGPHGAHLNAQGATSVLASHILQQALNNAALAASNPLLSQLPRALRCFDSLRYPLRYSYRSRLAASPTFDSPFAIRLVPNSSLPASSAFSPSTWRLLRANGLTSRTSPAARYIRPDYLLAS